MEKKLAIRGHATRGKEIIEILKMLGERNSHERTGYNDETIYYIDDRNNINCDWTLWNNNSYTIFTLEEFLEKYPYKIGDKVEVCETNKTFTIGNMIWEDELCTVHYVDMEDIEYYTANELKPYKETNMNVEFDLTKYSYEVKDGKLIIEEKKPKYPTTYEKCCLIMGGIASARHLQYDTTPSYKFEEDLRDSLETLRKLLICRDAYWKIAGEEMGLDKPWEPDWGSFSEGTYPTITKCNGNIVKTSVYTHDCPLAFPTEEIRDAFYENFKDLIEQCKELL